MNKINNKILVICLSFYKHFLDYYENGREVSNILISVGEINNLLIKDEVHAGV